MYQVQVMPNITGDLYFYSSKSMSRKNLKKLSNRTFANSVMQNDRPLAGQDVQPQKKRLPTIFDLAV
jgi:hypothetical protein